MPVIRFVREQRDVECYPGENLREVALREGIELYGIKGRLGNCGGCGQCITCFVEVVEGGAVHALSDPTAVELQRLKRRPQSWRLACQAMVQKSVLVLTRPQLGLGDRESAVAQARSRPLPEGPTAWPAPPPEASPAEPAAVTESPEAEAAETHGASDSVAAGGHGPGSCAEGPSPSATSGEPGGMPADGR